MRTGRSVEAGTASHLTPASWQLCLSIFTRKLHFTGVHSHSKSVSVPSNLQFQPANTKRVEESERKKEKEVLGLSSLTFEKGLVPEIYTGTMYLWMGFARPSPAFCSNLIHTGQNLCRSSNLLDDFFFFSKRKFKYQTLSKGAQIHSPDSESSRNRQGFKYHPPVALA